MRKLLRERTAGRSERESVEVIRRAFAALERGDLTAALVDFDAGAEIDLALAGDFPTSAGGGPAAARAALDAAMATWEDFRWTVREFLGLGDHVIVSVRMAGRKPWTASDVEWNGAVLFTVSDGRIGRLKLCGSKAEALEIVRPRE